MSRANIKTIAVMLVAMMLSCGLALAGAEDLSIAEAQVVRLSAEKAPPTVGRPFRKDPVATTAPIATAMPAQIALQLQRHVGDFFEMDIPEGWDVYDNTSGTFHAVLAKDPQEPLRKVYYFSEMGPLYFSQYQRELDRQVVYFGGQVPWYINHPVVEPFTPSNFLKEFHVIMESGSSMAQFIPQLPHLDNLEIISSQQMTSAISGGACELIRAVFQENGKAGQGIFMVTLVSVMPETGTPYGGWGFALMFTGITAPVHEFDSLEGTLTQSVASFQLSEAYVNHCRSIQQAMTGAIIATGRILSETSDMIMDSWISRNQSEDIVAAKTSDAMLGKERLYDPSTGQVYEFENGFYDQYNLDRTKYSLNGLQPLPDNQYELWTQAPQDGYDYLH